MSKICRKVVKMLLLKKAGRRKVKVDVAAISTRSSACGKTSTFGLWPRRKIRLVRSTGLAWTEVGGDLLTIEAAVTMPGKGNDPSARVRLAT